MSILKRPNKTLSSGILFETLDFIGQTLWDSNSAKFSEKSVNLTKLRFWKLIRPLLIDFNIRSVANPINRVGINTLLLCCLCRTERETLKLGNFKRLKSCYSMRGTASGEKSVIIWLMCVCVDSAEHSARYLLRSSGGLPIDGWRVMRVIASLRHWGRYKLYFAVEYTKCLLTYIHRYMRSVSQFIYSYGALFAVNTTFHLFH